MPVPSTRHHLLAFAIGISAVTLPPAFMLFSKPAMAIPVFDSTNYAQNLLIAARTLQQVNNQIQSLQNEAKMLVGLARNLSSFDFPELEALKSRLDAIDRLMSEARAISYRIEEAEAAMRTLFPDDLPGGGIGDRLRRAEARMAASRAAFQDTVRLQAEIVASVREDAHTLGEIAARSDAAEGSLQAAQATNQLLILAAKQALQMQQMTAAQYRSDSLERARDDQAAAEARAATQRFLGDGKAYTPR